MKTTRSAIALPIVALLLPGACLAHEDPALAATLRGVLASHLQAYDDEDVDRTLREVHTKSPEYDRTKGELASQLAAHDLRIELVSFRFLGHDDEFAVARTKTKFVGSGGSSFQDNVVDGITVFHQESGAWKLWSDEVLGVEFLPR